jgi:hypothetical protein
MARSYDLKIFEFEKYVESLNFKKPLIFELQKAVKNLNLKE